MFMCKDDIGDKVIEQKCKCGKTRYYHRLSGFYLPRNPFKSNFIESDISEFNGDIKMSRQDIIEDINKTATN